MYIRERMNVSQPRFNLFPNTAGSLVDATLHLHACTTLSAVAYYYSTTTSIVPAYRAKLPMPQLTLQTAGPARRPPVGLASCLYVHYYSL
jgi:hypothetical protein